MEVEENYMSERMKRIVNNFDQYMLEISNDEKIICETIETIFQEGKNLWVKAGDIGLKDKMNYVANIKGIIELLTWDAALNLFLVEGENTYVELKEIEKVYV